MDCFIHQFQDKKYIKSDVEFLRFPGLAMAGAEQAIGEDERPYNWR